MQSKRLSLGQGTGDCHNPGSASWSPSDHATFGGWHSAHRWQQGVIKLNRDRTDARVTSVRACSRLPACWPTNGFIWRTRLRTRKDTSRQGRYHNALFRETAKATGLIVKKDPTWGWFETKLNEELTACVRKFERRRHRGFPCVQVPKKTEQPLDGVPGETASAGEMSYVCLRHSISGRSWPLRWRCGCCGSELVRTEGH